MIKELHALILCVELFSILLATGYSQPTISITPKDNHIFKHCLPSIFQIYLISLTNNGTQLKLISASVYLKIKTRKRMRI